VLSAEKRSSLFQNCARQNGWRRRSTTAENVEVLNGQTSSSSPHRIQHNYMLFDIVFTAIFHILIYFCQLLTQVLCVVAAYYILIVF
jgi:hypothetical protein